MRHAVIHVDEDKAEEGGEALSQQTVPRATHWHVDVSAKHTHLIEEEEEFVFI